MSSANARSKPQGGYDLHDGFQPGYGASTQLHDQQPVQGSSPPSGGNKPKFVRPSDIYKRMSQEMEKERLSMDSNRPSLDGITGKGSGATSPEVSRAPGEHRRNVSFDRDDPAEQSLYGDRTLLPTVKEREQSTDSYPTKTTTFSSEPDSQSTGPKGISPQLPEVSRMSMFGDDFFSSGIKDLSTPKATSVAPVTESRESQPQISGKAAIEAPMDNSSGGDQPTSESQAAKKTAHEHLKRPSLPGGWVSETTNVDSFAPTPMESPGESGPDADARQLGTTLSDRPPYAAASRNDAPTSTVMAPDAKNEVDEGVVAASSGASIGIGHHPTPQSLPPLKTSGPLKSATSTDREEPTARATTNDSAPASSVYQQSPQTTTNPPSAAASPYDQSPAVMPVYSQHESANPTFAPHLGAPRKSTLSSVTTASPLKESDMLREEIMRSLSPAVDAPTSTARLGPLDAETSDAPELPRESRSLSGIYDDYYGFQEDKTLQETGQYLKSESERPQESGDDAARAQVPAGPVTTALPEIRPLSPNKQGATKPKITTENRERRFSFDAGPEHVTLSPVEASLSAAVSFGSNSDRQTTRPEHEEDRTETISTSVPHEPAASPEPASNQLHAPAQTISHQVSQLSIGATENVDVNLIGQPSPLSGSRSGTPRGATPIPVEDKVLVQPETKTSDEHRTPETELHPTPVQDKPDSLPEVANGGANHTANTSAKIMPFREILSIGPPQHRIQKFDETRMQFFNMDTGLGDWLQHMQSQGDGAVGDYHRSGKDMASSAPAPASQQPYYQQYLNASNPNLSMPPPTRTATVNHGGQSPNVPQGQQGTSGFNNGVQVGTKGKELLQAAGVLGNKGVKTGMKFFSKSKTKLRERGDKVFN